MGDWHVMATSHMYTCPLLRNTAAKAGSTCIRVSENEKEGTSCVRIIRGHTNILENSSVFTCQRRSAYACAWMHLFACLFFFACLIAFFVFHNALIHVGGGDTAHQVVQTGGMKRPGCAEDQRAHPCARTAQDRWPSTWVGNDSMARLGLHYYVHIPICEHGLL